MPKSGKTLSGTTVSNVTGSNLTQLTRSQRSVIKTLTALKKATASLPSKYKAIHTFKMKSADEVAAMTSKELNNYSKAAYRAISAYAAKPWAASRPP